MSDRVRGARPITAFTEGQDYRIFTRPYVGDLPYILIGECLKCSRFRRVYKNLDERDVRRSILDHMWSEHRGYAVLFSRTTRQHTVVCNHDNCDWRVPANGHRDGVSLGEQHLREFHNN